MGRSTKYQTWLLPSYGSGKCGVSMEMAPKLAEEQGTKSRTEPEQGMGLHLAWICVCEFLDEQGPLRAFLRNLA